MGAYSPGVDIRVGKVEFDLSCALYSIAVEMYLVSEFFDIVLY